MCKILALLSAYHHGAPGLEFLEYPVIPQPLSGLAFHAAFVHHVHVTAHAEVFLHAGHHLVEFGRTGGLLVVGEGSNATVAYQSCHCFLLFCLSRVYPIGHELPVIASAQQLTSADRTGGMHQLRHSQWGTSGIDMLLAGVDEHRRTIAAVGIPLRPFGCHKRCYLFGKEIFLLGAADGCCQNSRHHPTYSFHLVDRYHEESCYPIHLFLINHLVIQTKQPVQKRKMQALHAPIPLIERKSVGVPAMQYLNCVLTGAACRYRQEYHRPHRARGR